MYGASVWLRCVSVRTTWGLIPVMPKRGGAAGPTSLTPTGPDPGRPEPAGLDGGDPSLMKQPGNPTGGFVGFSSKENQ